MEFYDVVGKRRTIRDFTEMPVNTDSVKRILSAGLKAPTNDHMRNWEFVVVTDKSKIASILRPIPKKGMEDMQAWHFPDECQQKMYDVAVPKQYDMLSRSGCLILPFFKQATPLLNPETLSSLNAFASIWCCIENMLLAATAEGLGACLRIPFEEESVHIAEVLHHPKDYIMPCYIALGHPSPDAVTIKQKGVNPQSKIHFNEW